MFRTGLTFDMRAPDFGAPAAQLYDAALDMIAYADQHGMDQVIFSEHHCSDDGYIPAPWLLSAAAAARTSRIALVLGAIVLPLHDPVKVAELIAVGDLISQGRQHAVLAAGYAEVEFKAFGVSLQDRGRLMDSGLETISRALAGERFIADGREVFVRPLPFSPSPHLYVGGGVPATARRAARFGMGIWALNEEILPLYEQECRAQGREPGPIMYMPTGVLVSEDPDATWAEIAPHVLHQVRSYAALSTDQASSSSPWHGLDTIEALRASGIIAVVTPHESVEIARKRPITLLPLIAGLSPDVGWKSLELFVAKALPQIKELALA